MLKKSPINALKQIIATAIILFYSVFAFADEGNHRWQYIYQELPTTAKMLEITNQDHLILTIRCYRSSLSFRVSSSIEVHRKVYYTRDIPSLMTIDGVSLFPISMNNNSISFSFSWSAGRLYFQSYYNPKNDNPKNTLAFIKQLPYAEKNIVFESKDGEGNPIRAEFSVDGLAEAFPIFADACGSEFKQLIEWDK